MLLSAVCVTLIGATLNATLQHAAQRQINAERVLAFDAARNTIEELRTIDSATLPTLNGSGFDVRGPNGEAGGLSPVPGDPDGLPGEIMLQPESSLGSIVLYRARVTVRWSGRDPAGLLTIESLMGGRRR
jgi:hypothetical protein